MAVIGPGLANFGVNNSDALIALSVTYRQEWRGGGGASGERYDTRHGVLILFSLETYNLYSIASQVKRLFDPTTIGISRMCLFPFQSARRRDPDYLGLTLLPACGFFVRGGFEQYKKYFQLFHKNYCLPGGRGHLVPHIIWGPLFIRPTSLIPQALKQP